MKVQVLILCVAVLAVQANAFWIWDPESAAENPPVEVTENVEPEMAEAEEETGILDWFTNWWNENVPAQPDTEVARDLMAKGRDFVDQGHRMIVDGINSMLPEDMSVPEAEIPTVEEINADIQAKLDELKASVDTQMAKFRQTMENFDWDVFDLSEPEPVPEGTPGSDAEMVEVVATEESSPKGWFDWF